MWDELLSVMEIHGFKVSVGTSRWYALTNPCRSVQRGAAREFHERDRCVVKGDTVPDLARNMVRVAGKIVEEINSDGGDDWFLDPVERLVKELSEILGRE